MTGIGTETGTATADPLRRTGMAAASVNAAVTGFRTAMVTGAAAATHMATAVAAGAAVAATSMTAAAATSAIETTVAMGGEATITAAAAAGGGMTATARGVGMASEIGTNGVGAAESCAQVDTLRLCWALAAAQLASAIDGCYALLRACMGSGSFSTSV